MASLEGKGGRFKKSITSVLENSRFRTHGVARKKLRRISRLSENRQQHKGKCEKPERVRG